MALQLSQVRYNRWLGKSAVQGIKRRNAQGVQKEKQAMIQKAVYGGAYNEN